jgi:hypothetical protein
MFVSLTTADPDAPGKFLVAVREYVDPAGGIEDEKGKYRRHSYIFLLVRMIFSPY